VARPERREARAAGGEKRQGRGLGHGGVHDAGDDGAGGHAEAASAVEAVVDVEAAERRALGVLLLPGMIVTLRVTV
jgi:hypothetical protein